MHWQLVQDIRHIGTTISSSLRVSPAFRAPSMVKIIRWCHGPPRGSWMARKSSYPRNLGLSLDMVLQLINSVICGDSFAPGEWLLTVVAQPALIAAMSSPTKAHSYDLPPQNAPQVPLSQSNIS